MVHEDGLDGLTKRITNCKADSTCHKEPYRMQNNSSNDRPLQASDNTTPDDSLTHTSPYSWLAP